MSFNEKLSYTEHNVLTPTADFSIGFKDYSGDSDRINITVNNVPASEAGYMAQRINDLVIRLTPTVPAGNIVRLQRETNIDEPFYRFTAGAKFVAANIDANFRQILHSQQEVRNSFDFLEGNTLGVVEAAKEATERANEAADLVEDLIVGKVQTTNVYLPDGSTQQDFNTRVLNTRVETIADLPTNALDGDVVYVKGYYKPTNLALAQPYIGGGTRVYVASRKSVNDGFLCINGWVLQVEGNTVTCSQAGAKNDVSFDSSDAIQRALLYSGVTVIDSYYYTSKAVWFPISKIIRGIGMWSCGIVKTGNGVLNLTHNKSNGATTLNKNAVLVGYAERGNSSYNEDCHLSDFSLRYAGGQSNSIGLYVPSTCRSRYTNILVEDCDVGYQTSDSWLMSLNLFHVRNSRIAFYNGAPDGTIGINGTSNHYVNTYAEVCSEIAYYFDTYQYSSMSACAADKMPTTAKAVFKVNGSDIIVTSQGCEQIHTKLCDVSGASTLNFIGGQIMIDNRFQQSGSWSNAIFNLRGTSKVVSSNTKFVIDSDSVSTGTIAGFAAVDQGSLLEINEPAMHTGRIGSILDANSFNSYTALDIKLWAGSVAKVRTPYGGIERRSQNDLAEFLVGFKTPSRVLDTFLDIKTSGSIQSAARSLPSAYNLNTLLAEKVTGVMGQSFWSTAGTDLGYPTNNEVNLIHQMYIEAASGTGSVPYAVQNCYAGANGVYYRCKVDQREVSPWYLYRTSKNTTVDSNGFVKAASPVLQLYADKVELNEEASEQPISFEKIGTGDYLITGSLGFAQEGWYIEMPKDANGNVLVAVVYEQLEDATISVKTYSKKFDVETGDVVPNLSNPRDVPEGRWISIRLHSLIGDDLPLEVAD